MTVIELANLSDAAYSNQQTVKVDIRHRKMVPVGAAVKPVGFYINASSTAMNMPVLIPGMRWEETVETVEWKRLGQPKANEMGFSACIYEKGTEQVLAYRGTDDFYDKLIDDAAIAFGGVPMQALPALFAVQDAGLKPNAYITGHSLGGALAVIAAAYTGRAAVTFNAPGVMDSCMLVSGAGLSKGVSGLFEMMGRCVANARVWNIRIGGDVVSSWLTGAQPGRTTAIKAAECGYNAACLHSMDKILEKMGEAQYNEALDM